MIRNYINKPNNDLFNIIKGSIFSIFLTIIPLLIIKKAYFNNTLLISIISICGIIQIIVHLKYFLHLNNFYDKKLFFISLIFVIIIITILIIGSMWIMYHLNYNLMKN